VPPEYGQFRKMYIPNVIAQIILFFIVLFSFKEANCATLLGSDIKLAADAIKSIKRLDYPSYQRFSQSIRDNDVKSALKFITITDHRKGATVEDILTLVKESPDLVPYMKQHQTALLDIISSDSHKMTSIQLLELIDEMIEVDDISDRGMITLINLVKGAGLDHNVVSHYVNKIWVGAKFTSEQWNKFMNLYGEHITERDHFVNLKNAIVRRRYDVAHNGIKYLRNESMRNTIRSAIDAKTNHKIHTENSSHPESIVTLSMLMNNNGNLIYNDMYDILLSNKKISEYGNEWWKYYDLTARTLLQGGKFKEAYNIASTRMILNQKNSFAQHILSGWISYTFLYDYKSAVYHFIKASEVGISHSHKAKAYYLLAASYAKLQDEVSAQKYYNIAGNYPLSLYGQLAIDHIGKKVHSSIVRKINECHIHTHKMDTLNIRNKHFLIAMIFQLNGQKWRAIRSFERGFAEGKNDAEKCIMLSHIAATFGLNHTSYDIAYHASDFNVSIDALSYPIIRESSSSLVTSIARVETKFRDTCVSNKGAVGLMQVLEGTAQWIAKSNNIQYSRDMLSDRSYNVDLGSRYIHSLTKRYKNFVPAIAAYNAGMGRVDKWIKRNPIDHDAESVINWIESIPYLETRDYVVRVLESKTVYDALNKIRL